MWFDMVFERFAQESPFSVMLRGLVEHVFPDSFLDAIFTEHAQIQYQKELAFSTLATLLTEVVLRVRPSLRNAYRQHSDLPATLKSVYEKLQNTETVVCEALVRQTAQRCATLFAELPDSLAVDPIAGLRLRTIDGNFLAGTQHRLVPLRNCGAAALPGMTVVLRDGRTGLLTQILCREDAYTNERALLGDILPWIEANDLILADRNYCVLDFLRGIALRDAFYLIRHHKQLHLKELSPLVFVGRTASGEVYEKRVRLGEEEDGPECRLIVVKLDEATQDGETQVLLLSNVALDKADAILLADLYLRRWLIEHSFQVLTDYLRCEVDTLAYPKAALLGFCLAVCAYNLVAVLQGAVASVNGPPPLPEALPEIPVQQKVEEERPEIATPQKVEEEQPEVVAQQKAAETLPEIPVEPRVSEERPAVTAQPKGEEKPAVLYGRAKVEKELSEYEVAEEIAQDYSGLLIALPAEYWERFGELSSVDMARWLRQIAVRMRWERYRKKKQKRTKPAEVKRTSRGAHRSTFRVLKEAAAKRPKATACGPKDF